MGCVSVALSPTPPVNDGALSRSGERSTAAMRCWSSLSPNAIVGSPVPTPRAESATLGRRPASAELACFLDACAWREAAESPGFAAHARRIASSSFRSSAAAKTGAKSKAQTASRCVPEVAGLELAPTMASCSAENPFEEVMVRLLSSGGLPLLACRSPFALVRSGGRTCALADAMPGPGGA